MVNKNYRERGLIMAQKSRHNQQEGVSFTATRESQLFWRIAVYIRLSREDGNEESESVVNQKSILTEFIECYFDGQHVIVDFYVDDGLSGLSTPAEILCG